MRSTYLIPLIFVLPACTSTSGVQQMGRETYMVQHGVAPAAGGGPEARRRAFADAEAQCQKQNKRVLVTNTTGSRGASGDETRFELIFRCLDENDPEYRARPDYRTPPTTVIEDRRR